MTAPNGRARSCAIVTDTTASLPEGFAAQHGVEVVAQIVLFGEESYAEGRTISRQQFIERLVSSRTLPKTAAPEPRDLVEAYGRQMAWADTVLSIHPSALVSGTVRSAETAKASAYPEADIRIIDTQSVASGLGALVQEAVGCSEHGMPPDDIVAHLQGLAARCRTYFLIPTLDYLQRGGRIGRASALLGSVLHIKPILTFCEGQVAPYEKVRTQHRALERLVELVSEQCPRSGQTWLTVMHGDNAEAAQSLAARLQTLVGQAEVPVVTIGSSITTHAGPGVLGVSFFVAGA
jgi:DegV family protein with EDD domain